MTSGLRHWVVDRFALKPIYDYVLNRRVAQGAWYYGDGASLFLLLAVQIVTGACMMLTYSPSPDAAYQSVVYITTQQIMGWFIRGLHYWSAGLMVVMLAFHLFRQILVGGYKSPREGTWLIGVFLFFSVLTMSFTGYLLRWDERGIYGTQVVLHMFERVPLIGEELVLIVQGGPELSGLTLTRLFAVHVIIVPLILMILVSYHMYLVIVHSITTPTERQIPVHSAEQQKRIYERDAQSESRGEYFYPDTVAKSGAMAVIVFSIPLALTLVYGTQQLMPEANLVEPSMPREEWWFWWYSALIAITPPSIAPILEVAFPILLFAGLLALPFVDRTPYRGIRNRPIWTAVVVLAVVALVYLTDLRRRSPWTGWPTPEPPPIPSGVELAEDVREGHQLFAHYGCNSCHAIAGYGPQVGPDLARISQRSQDELRNYILNPPETVAMPSYRGRLPDEHLERVVAFVLVAQTFPWD